MKFLEVVYRPEEKEKHFEFIALKNLEFIGFDPEENYIHIKTKYFLIKGNSLKFRRDSFCSFLQPLSNTNVFRIEITTPDWS